jgi:hypothetical protein
VYLTRARCAYGSCATAGALLFVFIIILSYVTALVYLAFEGRAWPFERAKPPVPPRRRDR